MHEAKKENIQITVFNLSTKEYGLDIDQVHEVLRLQEIHPLPQAPAFIEGVITLRGHIIAVIDMRKRFNLEVKDSPKNRIIICRIKRMIVGIIVDGVTEVLTLSRDDLKPTPKVISTKIQGAYISGVAQLGKRIIIILNLEEILTKEDITELTEVGE